MLRPSPNHRILRLPNDDDDDDDHINNINSLTARDILLIFCNKLILPL